MCIHLEAWFLAAPPRSANNQSGEAISPRIQIYQNDFQSQLHLKPDSSAVDIYLLKNGRGKGEARDQ